jgi:hypothetical protein
VTQWTFRPPKHAKIQTKTREMDVLEAVENETLESYSRSRGFESFRAHTRTQAKQPAIYKQPTYLGVVFYIKDVGVAKVTQLIHNRCLL